MDTNTSRVDLLAAMLSGVLDGEPAEQGGGGLIWRMRGAVPTDARAAVSRAAGTKLTKQLVGRMSLARTDWSATRAFLLPSDHHGQIRLNVRGRERDGIVAPEEVDALCNEIADGLLSYRYDDGAPVLAAVDRTRDLVPPGSPKFDLLPDIVVRFPDRPTNAGDVARSERFGEASNGLAIGRSGGHTTDSWALLATRASAPAELGRNPAVTDVAPTALELLGIPHDDLPGRPLMKRVALREAA
jgi:predicted AlkP superfamily phosphohydrolase/phosphomutase